MAHSPIEGLGNFYNGLLHPVLVPAHLLLLVAAGLFLGQQGPKSIPFVLGTFAFAITSGLTVAWFSVATETETYILALSAALGLVIAVGPKVAMHWYIPVTMLAGFLLGMDSAQEELSGREKFVALFGSGIVIYLLILYPMSLAEYLHKKAWQRIGVRVVGSWIAASSLLVLALSFSSKNPA